jgi:hypothetical protein
MTRKALWLLVVCRILGCEEYPLSSVLFFFLFICELKSFVSIFSHLITCYLVGGVLFQWHKPGHHWTFNEVYYQRSWRIRWVVCLLLKLFCWDVEHEVLVLTSSVECFSFLKWNCYHCIIFLQLSIVRNRIDIGFARTPALNFPSSLSSV